MSDNVEVLYRKYGPLVYRRCFRLLKSEEPAREATQDTFVRLLGNSKEITSENHAGLLYRIATNVCLNIIKKDSRSGTACSYDPLLVEIADSSHFEVKSLSLNLLETIFAKEKESTGVLATLFYLDGMTYQEIGEETGMSVSGIRKRLRQLKGRISSMKEQYNETSL